jgi:hypothetical protein
MATPEARAMLHPTFSLACISKSQAVRDEAAPSRQPSTRDVNAMIRTLTAVLVAAARAPTVMLVISILPVGAGQWSKL